MKAPALVVAALFPLTGTAQVSCPLELPKPAVKVQAPAGWDSVSNAVPLTGFGMIDDRPEGKFYLIPSDRKQNKAGTEGTHSWEFDGGGARLYCIYDFTDSIQISRRIADSARKCSVTFKKNHVGHIKSLVATCER